MLDAGFPKIRLDEISFQRVEKCECLNVIVVVMIAFIYRAFPE
jgi:hypothetical protein